MAIPGSAADTAGLGPTFASAPSPSVVVRTPSPAFLLCHLDTWECVDVPASLVEQLQASPDGDGEIVVDDDAATVAVWLPRLTVHGLVPGALGTRAAPGSEAYAGAVQARQQRGWTYLVADEPVPGWALPPGVAPGGYRREAIAAVLGSDRAARHYHTAWDTATQSMPGAPTRWTIDRPGWNAWRLWLLTSGRLPGPLGAAIDEHRQRAARVVGRVSALLGIDHEDRDRRIAEARASVARLDGALRLGTGRVSWVGSDPIAAQQAARRTGAAAPSPAAAAPKRRRTK